MNVAVRPERLNLISLCTGGGGLDLGVELAMPSARSVVLVEREPSRPANWSARYRKVSWLKPLFTCRSHFPVGEAGEFTWYENDGSEGPKVGT